MAENKGKKGPAKTVEIEDSNKILNEKIAQRPVEISEADKQGRLALEGLLVGRKEDLINAQVEREKKRKLLIVELHSGAKFTIGEVERLVVFKPYPYDPLFPYSHSYFKELYNIYYPKRDYKEYPKPYYMSVLFKELIYWRFDRSVFLAIDAINPLITRKHRAKKIFQYLTPEGRVEAEVFRNQATEIAATCATGNKYEFRKKLWESHKVPYQLQFDFLKKGLQP